MWHKWPAKKVSVCLCCSFSLLHPIWSRKDLCFHVANKVVINKNIRKKLSLPPLEEGTCAASQAFKLLSSYHTIAPTDAIKQ